VAERKRAPKSADAGHVGAEVMTSERTISRMHWYLSALDDFASRGTTVVASHHISEKVGVKAGLIRKDLCSFGDFGRPSMGYNVAYLQKKIREILRVDEPKKVAWIGVDHFACDPDRAKKYVARNCIIAAIFDSNAKWIGKRLGDLPVLSTDEIEQTVRKLGIEGAIITSSQENAQELVTSLSAGGVRAIVNLSPSVAAAPPGVFLRNMDVAGELLMLCFLARDRQEAAERDIISRDKTKS
jgi:redox-sensing transcriptional repressor